MMNGAIQFNPYQSLTTPIVFARVLQVPADPFAQAYGLPQTYGLQPQLWGQQGLFAGQLAGQLGNQLGRTVPVAVPVPVPVVVANGQIATAGHGQLAGVPAPWQIAQSPFGPFQTQIDPVTAAFAQGQIFG